MKSIESVAELFRII